MTHRPPDLAPRSLDEERQELRQQLRQQLQQQRAQIAQQIASIHAGESEFPRSMTMRFLLRRPALVTRLLAETTALLLSARLLRNLKAALLLTRVLIIARKNRPVAELPAPSSVNEKQNPPA